MSERDPGAELRRKQQHCRTADGLDLFCRAWAPPRPHGILVIVHGLAEHSGRYRETAEHFARHGWAVCAGDLRSHGLSPDPRGGGRVHIKRFTDYFLDLDALIETARQVYGDLPLFLLGHSMGGLITISYVLQNPGRLAGAVISSPALGTHPDFKPPWLLRLLVALLSRLAPRMLFDSALDTAAISRDPEVVRRYIEDPLVTQKVSARWYSETLKAMKQAHRDAGKLAVPMLLMQSGADRLVDPDAPSRWAAASPVGRVELVEWDGFYHEMFNEPEKDRVRARALAWLDARTREPEPER